MARIITVSAAPSVEEGRMILWDVDDEHPGGEIFIYGGDKDGENRNVEVAETRRVLDKIASSELVRGSGVEDDEEPRPRRRSNGGRGTQSNAGEPEAGSASGSGSTGGQSGSGEPGQPGEPLT